MQEVEIPFVPSSQRLLKREEKDTIVIVGQVRQKRKRRAEKSLDSSQVASSSSSKQVDVPETKTRRRLQEAQDPFDFSSVPNILDDDPEAGKEEEEGRMEKRKKKQKKLNKKGPLIKVISSRSLFVTLTRRSVLW